MRLLRTERYKLRQVGVRGVIAGIPQAYVAAHGIGVGDSYYATEDEKGNLVMVFEHSPDYEEAKAKAGK